MLNGSLANTLVVFAAITTAFTAIKNGQTGLLKDLFIIQLNTYPGG